MTSSDALPHVRAVMVTGKDAGRVPLARLAVACFEIQSYPERTLLIVNHGPAPILMHPTAGVDEVQVTRPPTLGDLRNLALEEASKDGRADYLIQWDDDDYYHPERISVQVAAIHNGSATVLRRQMVADLSTGEAFVHERPVLEMSILHSARTACRYRSLERGEDTYFAGDIRRQHGLRGISNDSQLYVRLYHGMNTCGRGHFMRLFTRNLTADEQSYLDTVLARYCQAMS